MKAVSIADLQDHLQECLDQVRNGEEVIVNDRDVPVARILPFRQSAEWSAREAQMVAEGALTMPKQPLNLADFFSLPVGNVPHDNAVQAVIDSRGDW